MLHADVLGERARLSPDDLALVYVPTGERFSYADLDRRASQSAAVWLGTFGLQPGDRVGLLSHNRVEFVDCLFAAAKSGVVLVPLSTRATVRELDAIVRDSGLRVLLYESDFADIVVTLSADGPIEWFVPLEAPADGRRESWLALRETATADGAPLLPKVLDAEQPACLLYTSGTTGTPKGVILPHRMLAWNAYNTAICWGLRADDVSPIFTPLYHAGGLGAFLLPIFAVGGTIVLHRRFDPAEVWDTVARERCTVVLGVPTIWKLLADAPSFATADLSSVRWLISGGAPLPQVLIDVYQGRGIAFKQGYGLTEVGVNCFSMSVGDSVRKAGSIGRPMMYTRAKVVDESGAELPDEEVGELCLWGPHVCRGYWNNPDATAHAIDDDGWFHTGDLARRDRDGFYYIAGRKKDMIISGGVNIYPAEIEATLLAHPEVSDAAVVGVPHETWGEVGVAFIVRVPGSRVDADTLTAHVLAALAKHKLPRDFTFVDALPRTPYGKVVKDELRKAYLPR